MQARIERGDPTKIWDNRPILPPDLEWVWDAWRDLSTCRQYTMAGAGPIPWLAIHEWARHHGVTPDEEDELRQWVWALDSEMMKRDD